MIVNHLARFTFRQKLHLSFAIMMLLVAVNAAAATVVILSLNQQIEYCGRIKEVIRIVNQSSMAVNHFSRTNSREYANQVYTLLETLTAWLKERGRVELQLRQTGINAQLESFRVQFQRFVIENDQTAALENSTITLGRNLVATLSAMRRDNISLSADRELTNIITQVLNIQWQGQELAFTNTLPATERLRTITEQLMTDAERARTRPRSDNAEQRAFFRIMRDARDYVAMFERFIQQFVQTAHTEKELLRLSDHIHHISAALETRSHHQIRHRMIHTGVIIIVLFVVSFIAAQLIKNFLFVQITTPLNHVVDVTKQIAAGARGVRAVVGIQDEIGELATAVNVMTTNLQQSEAALLHANQTLEQRIRERTAELEESNRQLATLTRTDGLTGIANRRHFDAVLQQEYARHIRSGAPLALILLDVDFFKLYNDHYGHAQGDVCLQQVAQLLKQSVTRSSDCVARYGGEEFVCILPETPLAGAVTIAETIRQTIMTAAIPHHYSQVADCVTTSLGVIAAHCQSTVAALSLLTAADQQLYRAKANGRNCVASAALK